MIQSKPDSKRIYDVAGLLFILYGAASILCYLPSVIYKIAMMIDDLSYFSFRDFLYISWPICCLTIFFTMLFVGIVTFICRRNAIIIPVGLGLAVLLMLLNLVILIAYVIRGNNFGDAEIIAFNTGYIIVQASTVICLILAILLSIINRFNKKGLLWLWLIPAFLQIFVTLIDILLDIFYFSYFEAFFYKGYEIVGFDIFYYRGRRIIDDVAICIANYLSENILSVIYLFAFVVLCFALSKIITNKKSNSSNNIEANTTASIHTAEKNVALAKEKSVHPHPVAPAKQTAAPASTKTSSFISNPVSNSQKNTPAPVNGAVLDENIAKSLRIYKKLLDEGTISEEEFAKKKKQLMGL